MGASRTPATAASDEPSAQLSMLDPPGAAPVEGGQVAVVDLGPHGHADPGPVEQQPEATATRMATSDGDDLVPVDDHPGELEARCPAEELGQLAVLRLPDGVGQTDEAEHQADGHDERGGLRTRLRGPA